MTSYPIGRCALGPDCKFDTHELRPSHRCKHCNSVLHVLCSALSEQDDTIMCKIDCRKTESDPGHTTKLSGNSTAPNPKINPTTKTIVCKSCGGTDHARSTNKLCKNYKPRTKNPKLCPVTAPIPPPSDMPPLFCVPVMEETVSDVVKDVLFGIIDKVVKRMGGIEDKEEDSDVSVGKSIVSKPKFIQVGGQDASYTPVVDVDSSSFKFYKTIFKIMKKDYRGRRHSIIPTPDVLVDQYFPPSLMQSIANHSNAYVLECKRRDPNLDIWKRKTDSRPITISCMYQFFAIIYYMGIVKLPCKDDYWSTDDMMPTHDLCNQCGMSRNRFRFLWRYFHTNHPIEDDFEECDAANEEEETLIEQCIERVQVDQEEEQDLQDDADTQDSVDSTTQVNDNSRKKVSLWFDKMEPFISHFRKVSESMIHTLGTNLSLDEMMIRFMGRSNQTHRIKNKPISEGYKFFVLATSNGFIVNFTPDGRSAAKNDGQEYNEDKDGGKIQSMIKHVVSIIDRLKDKQKRRLRSSYRRVSTRTNDAPQFLSEQPQDNLVIAMDNYFTLPKVIAYLREKNIGVVGTARFRRGWPGSELKSIKVEQANFNDFYWTVDEHGTLLGRWMDNGLVFIVSTVHKVGKIVKRLRKKPRKTGKNKRHVDKIWGDKGAVPIFIPVMIDNYNFWMGGVDLSDQRIAYYHPDVRCYRNWIPMCIQVLSMIRNNSYVIHEDYYGKDALRHKVFALRFIKRLMDRAMEYYMKQLEEYSAPATLPTDMPSDISVGNDSLVSKLTMNSPQQSDNASVSSSQSRISQRISLQSISRASKASKSSKNPSNSNTNITATKRKLRPSSLPPKPVKKFRVDKSATSLAKFDSIRFQPPLSKHVRINTNNMIFSESASTVSGKSKVKKGKRQRCIYCSITFDNLKDNDNKVRNFKGEEMNWDKFVKRTCFICSVCKVYLCEDHFDQFHKNAQNK